MTTAGHHASGAIVALAAAGCFWSNDAGVAVLALLLGIYFGATVPDWIEHPLLPVSMRLVPHRTLTHWWPIWIALIVIAHVAMHGALEAFVTGTAIGSLLHIACDATTPMGIPLTVPWRRVEVPGAGAGFLHEWACLAVLAVAAGAIAAFCHAVSPAGRLAIDAGRFLAGV